MWIGWLILVEINWWNLHVPTAQFVLKSRADMPADINRRGICYRVKSQDSRYFKIAFLLHITEQTQGVCGGRVLQGNFENQSVSLGRTVSPTSIALALYVTPSLSSDIQPCWRLVFRPLDQSTEATTATFCATQKNNLHRLKIIWAHNCFAENGKFISWNVILI